MHKSSQSAIVQGVLFALLATFFWSGNLVLARGMIDTVPPCTIAMFRLALAGLVILPFATNGLRRHGRQLWRRNWWVMLCAGVLLAGNNLLLFIAARHTYAVNLALINNTVPIISLMLGAIFLKNKIEARQLLGIAVAAFGIVFLVMRGSVANLLAFNFNRGDLIILAGISFFAVYSLLLQNKAKGAGSASFLVIMFAVSALVVLPFSVYELYTQPFTFTFNAIVGLLYIAVPATAVSYWAWNRAVELIGANLSNIVYYVLPLFTALASYLFLGEGLGRAHVISAVFIISGISLAVLRGVGLAQSNNTKVDCITSALGTTRMGDKEP